MGPRGKEDRVTRRKSLSIPGGKEFCSMPIPKRKGKKATGRHLESCKQGGLSYCAGDFSFREEGKLLSAGPEGKRKEGRLGRVGL